MNQVSYIFLLANEYIQTGFHRLILRPINEEAIYYKIRFNLYFVIAN